MYGSAGTGKTLILCEAFKIKLSQLRSQGKRVRILATTFFDRRTKKLLNNLETKYLVNVKNIEVMGLEKLCGDLKVDYNHGYTPRDTMNRVITSLSNKYRDTDILTLLLVDEVWPCGYYQPYPDWRALKVRENVIWLLGLSPRTLECHVNVRSFEALPPLNNHVLTRHLVMKHRNCPQIRQNPFFILIYYSFVNIHSYKKWALYIFVGHCTCIHDHIIGRVAISPWLLTKS